MKRYRMIFSRKAEDMLKTHVEFLSRVSPAAAGRMRHEFARTARAVREAPWMFPVDEGLFRPGKQYRSALFSRWYKAVFSVEGDTIYLDAVVDCRMDPGSGWPGAEA